MWQRLKNIWAWSAYHPSGPPQDIGFSWTGWLKPQTPEQNDWPPKATITPGYAEIIYPSKQAEILKAKPDPSLDDLLR